MFVVYKRIGATLLQSMSIGTFETFEEARKFAIENICEDVEHEGGEESYFFSDSTGKEAYKVHIKKQ